MKEMKELLEKAETREEVRPLLQSCSKKELVEIADYFDINYKGKDIVEAIIEGVVGARLRYKAITNINLRSKR